MHNEIMHIYIYACTLRLVSLSMGPNAIMMSQKAYLKYLYDGYILRVQNNNEH